MIAVTKGPISDGLIGIGNLHLILLKKGLIRIGNVSTFHGVYH